MRHKLHDGPSEFVISGGKIKPPPVKPIASIAALQWAAEQSGQSYGQFCLNLKREDETRIQMEFEAWKRQRDAEQAARMRAKAEELQRQQEEAAAAEQATDDEESAP